MKISAIEKICKDVASEDDEKKQIEAMAKDVARSIVWCDEVVPAVNCLGTAAVLYGKNYRKQSEGEWVSNCQTDEYICSLCGGFSPIDCEKENFYKSNFCPNCGAKMKGGAE